MGERPVCNADRVGLQEIYKFIQVSCKSVVSVLHTPAELVHVVAIQDDPFSGESIERRRLDLRIRPVAMKTDVGPTKIIKHKEDLHAAEAKGAGVRGGG